MEPLMIILKLVLLISPLVGIGLYGYFKGKR